MSRTDKTRPYRLKLAEAEAADPYGIQREAFVVWRHELRGCSLGQKCWLCHGWSVNENGRRRRARKTAARQWQREYE